LDSIDYDSDFKIPQSLCKLWLVSVEYGGVSAVKPVCQI